MMKVMMPAQPELLIEAGSFRRLPELLQAGGYRSPVLVTGGRSVRGRDEWGIVTEALLEAGYPFLEFTVRGEPSPETVNDAIGEILRDAPGSDVVVAIGGGSALDAGKAVAAGAAMAVAAKAAAPGNKEGTFDISRYLEGVGDREPSGETLPLIAFPTTAGTGTEASMNAVISRIGPGGFKKSLRHPRFVPSMAIIDPDLHQGCPLEVTRACGLDAVTQLLEAYVSIAASPLTDALAALGLQKAGASFPRLIAGEDTPELRAEMALAAYLSGVCLAAAGLGLVHGFASPLGAMRDIPHGVVCGLLLGPTVEHALRKDSVSRSPADHRTKYGNAARAMGFTSAAGMVEQFFDWAEALCRLEEYRFTQAEIPLIARNTGLKNHPVKVEEQESIRILESIL